MAARKQWWERAEYLQGHTHDQPSPLWVAPPSGSISKLLHVGFGGHFSPPQCLTRPLSSWVVLSGQLVSLLPQMYNGWRSNEVLTLFSSFQEAKWDFSTRSECVFILNTMESAKDSMSPGVWTHWRVLQSPWDCGRRKAADQPESQCALFCF